MQELNIEQVWKDVLESVQVSVSPAIYQTWFTRTTLAKLVKKEDGKIAAEVGCATSFVKDFIENRYFGIIHESLKKITDSGCDLVFTVQHFQTGSGGLVSASEATPLFGIQNTSDQINHMLTRSKIRPGFTFDNYAVSGSNQMAWAAAEAVAKEPGKAYNPLFLYGGVGVGKTHLMIAVGHKIIETNADSKVMFCTGEEFTNDIVEGIKNKTTQLFRDKYRKLDCLLLDDIQFIAGKDAVQEEFFHTFNAVTTAGGQIILTSDKPPSEISRLEERLKSRFEAGLIVDIGTPDFELRCAITQIKAGQIGMALDAEQIQLIAGNIESARKIQGFLVQLTSASKFKKTPVDTDLIKEILGKGGEENGDRKTHTTPDQVIDTVLDYYSLGKRAIMGATRARTVAQPRQILMYLLRIELGLALQEVGRLIGGRDHTTVMHAVGKITDLASKNVQVSEDILGIKKKLWG